MTTLLLDADIIAFKIASVSQKVFQFPDCEPHILADDWSEVTPRIDHAIAKLQADLETDKVIVCLSCPTAENWRLEILPTYKGKRDYSKRPIHLAAIKDYMEANWPSYRRPTLEADDIMGILATDPKLVPGKKVIVSSDKDMKTIPGNLCNPDTGTRTRFTEAEADYWHLYQTLAGDATDNYKGCPGVGPKKAEKLLHAPNGEPYGLWSMWQAVLAAFEAKKLTEEDALTQARVARICRSSDYDFSTKKVIPWTPNQFDGPP